MLCIDSMPCRVAHALQIIRLHSVHIQKIDSFFLKHVVHFAVTENTRADIYLSSVVILNGGV